MSSFKNTKYVVVPIGDELAVNESISQIVAMNNGGLGYTIISVDLALIAETDGFFDGATKRSIYLNNGLPEGLAIGGWFSRDGFATPEDADIIGGRYLQLNEKGISGFTINRPSFDGVYFSELSVLYSLDLDPDSERMLGRLIEIADRQFAIKIYSDKSAVSQYMPQIKGASIASDPDDEREGRVTFGDPVTRKFFYTNASGSPLNYSFNPSAVDYRRSRVQLNSFNLLSAGGRKDAPIGIYRTTINGETEQWLMDLRTGESLSELDVGFGISNDGHIFGFDNNNVVIKNYYDPDFQNFENVPINREGLSKDGVNNRGDILTDEKLHRRFFDPKTNEKTWEAITLADSIIGYDNYNINSTFRRTITMADIEMEGGSEDNTLVNSLPNLAAEITNESGKRQPALLLPVEFITPAGDPVAQPKDAGDGQNEFTFNSAKPGVLEINLKVKVAGIGGMPDDIQNKFLFEIDAIGNSQMQWDAANAGGKPTFNGDFMTAKVKFTGLPQNNSDFGKKMTRIKFDGSVVAEEDFEVFYTGTAKNHQDQANPTYPNWFVYYKQNEGGGAYKYRALGRSVALPGGGDVSIQIANEAYNGDTYINTSVVNGQLSANGFSNTVNKYYANFIGVLTHERSHATNEIPAGTGTDNDRDFLPSAFEVNTSKTDPNNPYSARGAVLGGAGNSGAFDDGEIYAGGVEEERGVTNANTDEDWANPGTNHK